MKMYCWSSRSRIFETNVAVPQNAASEFIVISVVLPAFWWEDQGLQRGWISQGEYQKMLSFLSAFLFLFSGHHQREAWPESQNAVWPWMYKKQRCCFFPFQKGSFDKAKGTKHRSKQLMNVCGQNRHAVKFACCPVWYDLTRRQILFIWWIKAGYHWTYSLCECWARFTSSQRSTSAVNILP